MTSLVVASNISHTVMVAMGKRFENPCSHENDSSGDLGDHMKMTLVGT